MIGKVSKLSLIVLYTSIQSGVYGSCTSTCHCSSDFMLCNHGELPTYIPSNVKELYVEQFDFYKYNRSEFKDEPNISKLDIQADHGHVISSRSFDQFTNLTYLGLHGKEIIEIHQDAFLGLNNLLTLNLSSNPRLQIDQISGSLNSESRGQSMKVLPNLLSLSIAKVKTSIGIPVDIDGYFFKSVASGRKLKYLDISQLNILNANFTDFLPLCKSVQFVDIRKSVIGSGNYWGAPGCTSLRTLDISGIIIPMLRTKFTFQTFLDLKYFCHTFQFFTYVEALLANRFITENNFEIKEYFLDMSSCPFRIQKISLDGNRIKWMNMTVYLHEKTKQSISEFSISYNGLEYISPLVLQPSQNIHTLDFSNNNLNEMNEKYTDDFEKLFWAQTKLRYLNLSHNSLSKIPTDTFLKNVFLKLLDISHNNIKFIDFSMNQLSKLEKFASHNKIHTLGHDTRMQLQLFSQRSSNNTIEETNAFFIYLEGNQFQCTCDKENMMLIEWLHSTEVINEYETLTCTLGEDFADVRGTGLDEINHFCRMQVIRKIAGISIPIVSSAVILGIIVAVFVKKRRTRKLMIRNVITQIELGIFPLPHLAFLSYCSEDTDLVMNKIYPEISGHLTEMTHSNQELVCIGDKHFRPGFSLHDEVMRCVDESSVFVAIISRNFCQRNWCNLEIGEAYDQKKPIIMLMIEYVEKQLMDDFLQKIFDRYTHAAWKLDENGGHIEPEWKLFCKSIIKLAGKSIATAKTADISEEINA